MDGIHSAVTGQPMDTQRGALIAFSLGMLIPGGHSLIRRAQENAAACVAETTSRQLFGLEAKDPHAIAVNALFCSGAGVLAEGFLSMLGRLYRRTGQPAVVGAGAPVLPSQVSDHTSSPAQPMKAQAGRRTTDPASKPRVGTPDLPFEIIPPGRAQDFKIGNVSYEQFAEFARIVERHGLPVSSPKYLRPADGLFETLFAALDKLKTDALTDAELEALIDRLAARNRTNTPPQPQDFNSPFLNYYDNLGYKHYDLLSIHDYHLLLAGGLGTSPSMNYAPGRGGESGFYSLATSLGIEIGDTTHTLGPRILYKLDEWLTKANTTRCSMDEIKQKLRSAIFNLYRLHQAEIFDER